MSMLTPPGSGARKPVRRGVGRAPVGTLALMVVLTVGLAGTAWWISRGDPGADVVATTRPGCPTPGPPPAVGPPGAIRLNVYNATERRGLATRVAAQLRRRGFRVERVDDDPLRRTVRGAAEVRFGPAGARPARTVVAQLAPSGQVGAAAEVGSAPDKRRGGSVDLVLGTAFAGLRPPAEAAAAAQPTPQPVPSGCRLQPPATR